MTQIKVNTPPSVTELEQIILDYARARAGVDEFNYRKGNADEAAPMFDALFQAEQLVLSVAKVIDKQGGRRPAPVVHSGSE